MTKQAANNIPPQTATDNSTQPAISMQPNATAIRLFKACLILATLYAIFGLWEYASDVKVIRLPLFEDSWLFHELSAAATETVDRVNNVTYLQHHFLPHLHTERRQGAMRLQRYLTCAVERGELRRVKEGKDKTRRVRYQWHRDHSCVSSVKDTGSSSTESDLCEHLRGKRLLMLGDRVQYSLHNLLLDRLSVSSDPSSRTCAGAEFCNWHPICDPFSPLEAANARSNSNASSYFPQHEAHPQKHLVPANWSHIGIMRYAPSSSLLFTSKRGDRRLTEPHLSSASDIRDNESFWKFWVAGSDIVVLSKAPVPAPAWSWKALPTGRYQGSNQASFAVRPVRDQEFIRAFQNLSSPLIRSLDDPLPSSVWEYAPSDIIQAAIRATILVWLPGTLRTLSSLQHEVDPEKHIVWRGEWFEQEACYRSRSRVTLSSIETLLGLKSTKTAGHGVDDPWRAFHNVQVLFQALCLQQILPHFDIPYLPHYMHLSPFNTGFVDSSPDTEPSKIPHSHSQSYDCHSINPSSSDQHIDRVFLDGLSRVLSWRKMDGALNEAAKASREFKREMND